MTNIVALQRRNIQIRNKVTLNTQTQKTARLLIVVLTTMIVILSCISLFVTGQNGLKGNQLTQQKLRNQELRNQSKELAQKLTISASIKQQQESIQSQKMTPTSSPIYVKPEDNDIN